MSLKEAVRAAMSLLECLSELLGYQLSITSSLINIHVLCGSEYSMKTHRSRFIRFFCCLCVFSSALSELVMKHSLMLH